MRASGPGGQSVNTTDSAVRVTHLPTGTTAVAQAKSQKDNKKTALAVLMARLQDVQTSKAATARNKKRSEQIGKGMRGDKRRTYNFKANRVTDHVTGKTVRDVKGILRGNLDLLR